MKINQKINRLLQDFEFVSPELAKIVRALRKTVLVIAPKAEEKIMYGGIVFITDRMFCGIFLRKKYVTVEFDRGYEMDNTEKHLEGSGQYRRHLKIYNKGGIESKKAKSHVLESFNLKQQGA